MRVIGNNVGYLIAILVVTYLNTDNRKIAFIRGTLTNVIASFVYYGCILFFYIGKIGNTESLQDIFKSFAFWCVVGAICSVVATAAMTLLNNGKNYYIRLSSLIVTYISMLIITYDIQVIPILNQYKYPEYVTGYFGGNNFTSDIYNAVFAAVLVTAFFLIALIKLNHSNKTKQEC